jgi:hypothetical protein
MMRFGRKPTMKKAKMPSVRKMTTAMRRMANALWPKAGAMPAMKQNGSSRKRKGNSWLLENTTRPVNMTRKTG